MLYYALNPGELLACKSSALPQSQVILSDRTVARRDSYRLLQAALINVKGLYDLPKFCGNVKLLMYAEL